MASEKLDGVCMLCGRTDVRRTVHHLLPKEEGGAYGATVDLCIPCHKQIHAIYSNKEIAERLTTIGELQQDDRLRKFIKWIRKQPSSAIPKIKKANQRKKKR